MEIPDTIPPIQVTTVAALPPVAPNDEEMYAMDGVMPDEPFGEGVLVTYQTSGPFGAGWYVVGSVPFVIVT